MYTLVIVDDEPAIAEGICRLLDWKSLGFERIRTARSCFEVAWWMYGSAMNLVMN